MARGPSKAKSEKEVSTLTHEGAARRNIPTAEYQSVAERLEEIKPVGPTRYPRATPLPQGESRERDEDLDPQIVWRGAHIRLTKDQTRQLQETGEVEIGDAQLVWKGKDRQDWSDLVAPTPPIYIQEKVHPKAIIDDLVRRSKAAKDDAPDLFADFNGLNDPEARTEFYQHDQHWSNRMILGDSLAVMASLAERKGLRGKVQCIYFDPPYGIKFNSNWQVSTQSRDVKDGKQTDISREPEQVKAFRDTWKEGIHSYLTYLRDRLTVVRDLLTESGSIFVQIGDENVHRVRALMDEVFGSENVVSQIAFRTTTGRANAHLPSASNFILWYARNISTLKSRQVYQDKSSGSSIDQIYSLAMYPDGRYRRLTNIEKSNRSEISPEVRVFTTGDLTSSRPAGMGDVKEFKFNGNTYNPGKGTFKTDARGLGRLGYAGRLWQVGANSIRFIRYYDDFPVIPLSNVWSDTGTGSFTDDKVYVVQTGTKVVERCLLMGSDPGDIVLDPTCGSGTSGFIAEQWGRRWITIDTSRVALALARTRLMSARYPYYFLSDSIQGRRKEQEVSGKNQPVSQTLCDVTQGFVYERVPHIMLKDIAGNGQIDEIWQKWQTKLEPLRADLNTLLSKPWQEWEIPREAGDPWPATAAALLTTAQNSALDLPRRTDGLRRLNVALKREYKLEALPERPYDGWPPAAMKAHAEWWGARIARQKEIDASIAKAADVELLYDRPYEDKSRVRVAGPFTVESLSPHRVLNSDDEELIDMLDAAEGKRARIDAAAPQTDFAEMVLEHLRSAGVHQSEKRDTIRFTSLQPWPGVYIGAKGTFMEGETERQAGIFIGPEFGTMTRVDLVAAAREATDARVDVLIACAFAFDAHASELTKLGPLPILKAKMNPDLHMSEDLKNTGKGNLFVVFGEPDFDVRTERDGRLVVKINGVDVFDPNTGEIRSGDTNAIAAWFIDTDYNEESFFVRHAYFLGAGDPYKSLKTALQAEIDEDAWATLYRAESRPFARPATGKFAVKVINHFGDEVMKVFRV